MLARIRRGLSFANVCSVLALVIALPSALPIGLTQPEPGGFAKPELERTRFIAHAVLTALDKLA